MTSVIRIYTLFLCMLAANPVMSIAQTWKSEGIPISYVKELNLDKRELIVRINTEYSQSLYQNDKKYLKTTIVQTTKKFKTGNSKIDIKEVHTGRVKEIPQATILASGYNLDENLGRRYIETSEDSPVTYTVKYITGEGQNSIQKDTVFIWTGEKDTILLNKSTLRHIYKNFLYLNRPYKASFTAGIGFTNLLNYRMVMIEDPSFQNHDQIDLRSQNERGSYGQAYSLAAGLNIGRKDLLYLEISSVTKGFKNRNSHLVDWKTGLPGAGTNNFSYKFRYQSIGLGYSRSKDNRVVNPIVDMGINLNFLREFSGETGKVDHKQLAANDITKPIKRTDLVLKAGFGIKIVPSMLFSIKVIPTLYYGLIPVNSGSLNTRFTSLGIHSGIYFDLHKKSIGTSE